MAGRTVGASVVAIVAVAAVAWLLLRETGSPPGPSRPVDARESSPAAGGPVETRHRIEGRVVPDDQAPATSRAARLEPAQLATILAACGTVTSENLDDIDLSKVDLLSVLRAVVKSGAAAPALLGEIDALPAGDSRRPKLLIALAMAPGFTAAHAEKLGGVLTAELTAPDATDGTKSWDASLATAHALRLQDHAIVSPGFTDGIRRFYVDPTIWNGRRSAMVAAVVLDGFGEGTVPQAARELSEFARHGPPDVSRAAWRLLTRGESEAFAQAAGVFLGGAESGQPQALFSTSNPAHEPTLRLFLQGDTKKRVALTGYAVIGLLRIGTPTALEAATAALKGEGAAPTVAARALAWHARDVDERVDVETLPGLLHVMSALGPSAPESVNAAFERVTASLNGLGITPARRRRVRADLLRFLDSMPAGDPAQQALTTLGMLGTSDDVASIERISTSLGQEDAGRIAIEQIRARDPGTMR